MFSQTKNEFERLSLESALLDSSVTFIYLTLFNRSFSRVLVLL